MSYPPLLLGITLMDIWYLGISVFAISVNIYLFYLFMNAFDYKFT